VERKLINHSCVDGGICIITQNSHSIGGGGEGGDTNREAPEAQMLAATLQRSFAPSLRLVGDSRYRSSIGSWFQGLIFGTQLQFDATDKVTA
jgi:hypothetical protein